MRQGPSFIIEGGHRLSGEITPQGAKNEALQVICAVLLTGDQITIKGVPDILDVRRLLELIRGLGVEVESLADGAWRFQAREIDLDYLHSPEYRRLASSIRGSVMTLGPLLARFARATLPAPGGDAIGRRPLDTHFHGLAKLGATCLVSDDKKHFEISSNGRLNGAYILLEEASVTGTANLVMAAVLAEGTTTLYNAACEPYVQQLCSMLNAMGARISGVGSNLLVIEGVDGLGGTTHRCLPDMVEVGSFIGLAAMTQSDIRILACSPARLGAIPNAFRKLGIDVQEEGDDLYIPAQEHYAMQTNIDGTILKIDDAPWPGLTPDVLSIVLVTAIQAKGNVLIHQKMFESRLFFVDRLIEMGAQIILCDPHRATVMGYDRQHALRGITMSSPDIRAGVALLIAALTARGTSTIHNIAQIDRGYERIDERLNALGAHIQRD